MKIALQTPSVRRIENHVSFLVDNISPSGLGPKYGNYCGQGHGDRSYQAPAIDAVDQVCKKHDKCWDNSHDLNCGCDRKFLGQMAAAVAKPGLSAKARAYGAGAIAYFSSAPCTCMRKICYNYPSCSWRGCRIKKRCDWVPYGGGIGGIGPC